MFRGTITKYSTPIYGSPQILLTDITLDGEEFRDHVWVKQSKRLNIYPIGTVIEFTGIVYDYLSSTGYKKGVRHIRSINAVSI
jgi:hypothetical protein